MRYKIAIPVLNRVWLSISYRTPTTTRIHDHGILFAIIGKFFNSLLFHYYLFECLNKIKKKNRYRIKRNKYIIQEGSI